MATLLELDGSAFIEAAYATLLGRGADPAGIAHCQDRLAAGRSKVELLGQLQASDEARATGRVLPGLHPLYRSLRLQQVPVAGPLIRLVIATLRRFGPFRRVWEREPAHVVLRMDMEARLASLAAATGVRHHALEARLVEQLAAAELAARRLAAVQTAQDSFVRRTMAALAESNRQLSNLTAQGTALARQVTALEDGVVDALRALHGDVARQDAWLGGLDPAAAVRHIDAAAAALQSDLDRRLGALAATVAEAQGNVAEQRRQLDLLLHALREPAPGQHRPTMAARTA